MMLSLDGLLDYNLDDELEKNFEVSLFAELFHEMLQSKYVETILKSLQTTAVEEEALKKERDAERDAKDKKRDEERKAEKLKEEAEKEAKKAAGEEESEGAGSKRSVFVSVVVRVSDCLGFSCLGLSLCLYCFKVADGPEAVFSFVFLCLILAHAHCDDYPAPSARTRYLTSYLKPSTDLAT